jgi:ABC-2 type transport system ATP-binding protein
MAAIEVDGLTRYYDETRGVEGLTFTVEEGEVFCVLGPNGAGKTTAIRTLMGFQSPTKGRATVLGHDITSGRDVVKMKQEVGYIPSDPTFERDITGRELLAYHASLKDDERSEELIDLFDPPLDRTVTEYSRSDTRKLAIVLAFMHDPALAVLDDLTAGLDPLMRERFYEFIHAEKQQGTTVLFTSESLGEAYNISDRVGILRNGHLVEIKKSETLLAQDCKSVRVTVTETVDAGDFALDGTLAIETTKAIDQNENESETGEESAAHHGTTVWFIYSGEYDTLFEHLLEYTVDDLAITETPLETVFTRFYGARLGATTDEKRFDMTETADVRGGMTGIDWGNGGTNDV